MFSWQLEKRDAIPPKQGCPEAFSSKVGEAAAAIEPNELEKPEREANGDGRNARKR